MKGADRALLLRPAALEWDIGHVAAELGDGATVHDSVDALLDQLVVDIRADDHVLIMSNGSFGNLHARLLQRLSGASS